MGSDYVDGSPSLGSVFGSMLSGMSAAPGKALDQMLTVEQIKAARANQGYAAAKAAADAAEEQRKAAIYGQETNAANAFSATVPAATVAPRPYTATDISTPALLDAPLKTTTPAGTPMGDMIDPRELAQAQATRNFFDQYGRTLAYKSPTDLPKAYANTQVGVGGVPDDPTRREQLQYLQKGTFDKPDSKPFVVLNPDTKAVEYVYASSDGGRTNIAGEDMLKKFAGKMIAPANAADTNPAPKSIFDSPGQTQNALVTAANGIATGKHIPNPEETRVLAYGLRQQYQGKEKELSDALGNTIMLHDFMEKNVPPELRPLVQHIADTLYPQAQAAPTAATTTTDETGAPAYAGAAPAAAPQTAEQRLFPPMTTSTIREAPASHEQQILASSTQRADAAQQIIEKMIFAGGDPNSNHLPAQPYLPDWKAAMLAERSGDNFLANTLINQLDPQAREYYAASKAWVEPVLRQASGAAIRPEEYKDYMSMFIPNAGDSPQLIAQKLTRMREWRQTIGQASNANQATAMLIQQAQARHDPEAQQLAERLRVRATNAGRLDTDKNALPAATASTAPVTVSPATSPAPAATPTSVQPRKAPPAAAPATGRTVDDIVSGR